MLIQTLLKSETQIGEMFFQKYAYMTTREIKAGFEYSIQEMQHISTVF